MATRTFKPSGRPRGGIEGRLTAESLRLTGLCVKAMELRLEHLTFSDIAKRMVLPGPKAAYELVLAGIQAIQQEPAEEVLKLELERLDIACAAILPRVKEGDPRAIDTYNRLLERRAAYLGLDAPKKTEDTIKGVILHVSGDELAAIYRASRGQLLEAGSEPLDLADRGGAGERPTPRAGANPLSALAPPAPGSPGD